MTARYAPTSHSIRAIAATVALATVLALFEFVAGLGDAGAEALAQAQAANHQITQVASVPSTVAQQ